MHKCLHLRVNILPLEVNVEAWQLCSDPYGIVVRELHIFAMMTPPIT